MALWLLTVAAVLVGCVYGQQTGQITNTRYRFPVDGPNVGQNRTTDPTTQIINGQVVNYGDHPYTCSLQEFYQGRWYFICGSVIYNENTILTAAHCVEGLPANVFRVRCGEFDFGQTDEFEVTKAITAINIHPGWQNNPNQGFPNDIATMRVDTPLVFNDYVNTLPLIRGRVAVPRDCQLIGWGITESGQISFQLREVTIPRLSNRRCSRTWRTLINRGHICFQDRGQPDSACSGDSGGPAVCGDYLVGVTSWGPSDCGGAPSVYTRLSRFRRWIIRNSF